MGLLKRDKDAFHLQDTVTVILVFMEKGKGVGKIREIRVTW
jgi:hypothetical protein